jgi:hypothetical protein
MVVENITSPKGNLTIISKTETSIKSSSDVMEIYFNTNSDTIVINKADIDQTFFDLKTGLAGNILQKISSYHKRLIILGEFSSYTSKSLHDFIYESNKTGKVIFTDSMEKALSMLK